MILIPWFHAHPIVSLCYYRYVFSFKSRDRAFSRDALERQIGFLYHVHMPEIEIKFSPEQVPIGSYRLLELPPDLCKLIESSVDDLKFVLTRSMLLELFLIYDSVWQSRVAQKMMPCCAPQIGHTISGL